MPIVALVLGALAGAYGVVAYSSAPTIVQQSVAVHFFVVAAVLIGCGVIAYAVSRRKP